jgi:twitching motility two-component system response regulator PilG
MTHPLTAHRHASDATMTPKPRFTLAVTGFDATQLRMIEIVFRHSLHNRYAYRLAVSERSADIALPARAITDAAIDARGIDAADILLAGRSQHADADLSAWLLALRKGLPVISALGIDQTGTGRYRIDLGFLARDLVRTLNEVVDAEGLHRHQAAGARLPSVLGAADTGELTEPTEMIDVAKLRPRVLVIDGNANFRHELACLFATMGVQVEAVSSGAQALERLVRGRVDLATIDIGLPDTDGLTLARQIRNQPQWRGLPILALTDRVSTLEVIRGAVAGCSAYLAKPLEPRALRTAVARELERTMPRASLPPQLRTIQAH